MKNLFTRRLIAAIMAIVVCVSVAGASFAVGSNTMSTRTITVDTSNVINESYKGIGINHWTSPYVLDMNDAYQLVNEKRNNMQQLKYVRLLFMPNWLVDTTLPEEQQQYEWENGIYHFDNLNIENFFRKVKMYQESGTEVMVNFGGTVTEDIASWWQVKDAGVTNGSTRAAPANLEAFADATCAVIKYAWDNGYDNVVQLSFYNEVNGGNYEAFYNKKIYWTEMVKQVHYELASHTYTGNTASEHYGKNIRDEIMLYGADLVGWGKDGVIEFMEYISKNLVDKNGNALYDAVSIHHYPVLLTYDEVLDSIDNLSSMSDNIYGNEYGPRTSPAAGEDYVSNFKYSETAILIAEVNAGYKGAAAWVASADMAPDPINMVWRTGLLNMWDYPSKDVDNIVHVYGQRMLYTRYIPTDSKVYKNTVASDDILCAVFGVEDGNKNIEDMTVLLDVEESSSQRELTIELGKKVAGCKFKRMVYYYPEKQEDGFERLDVPYENGDLIPVSDKVLTADENGNIVDILPTDKHCEIIYTTLDEQVQIVTDENYVTLTAGESIDFDVTAIYGTDNNNDLANVTWEIYGKSRSDVNGGYNLTTQGAGIIDQNGTYNSTGTVSGDTVAIKISSKYDPTAYTVIIVDII